MLNKVRSIWSAFEFKGWDCCSNGRELLVSLAFLLLGLSLCRWFLGLDIFQEFRVCLGNLFFLTASLEKLLPLSQLLDLLINLVNWWGGKHFQRLELVLNCIWNVEGLLFLFLVLVLALDLLSFLRTLLLNLRLLGFHQLDFLVFPVRISCQFCPDINCLFRGILICLVSPVEVILDVLQILNQEVT